MYTPPNSGCAQTPRSCLRAIWSWPIIVWTVLKFAVSRSSCERPVYVASPTTVILPPAPAPAVSRLRPPEVSATRVCPVNKPSRDIDALHIVGGIDHDCPINGIAPVAGRILTFGFLPSGPENRANNPESHQGFFHSVPPPLNFWN